MRNGQLQLPTKSVATHLQGSGPDRIAQILHIRVRQHLAGKVSQSPLNRSNTLAAAQLAQQTRLVGLELFLFFTAKVGVGRDGGRTGELSGSLFGFSGRCGIV